jgi:hypothetical protein
MASFFALPIMGDMVGWHVHNNRPIETALFL